MTSAEPFVVCRACGGSDVRMFLSLADLPVHCNVLWGTREEALDAPKGRLELGLCANCGHIYNYAFDKALMSYSVEYENSLHFSGTFEAFSQGLANHLVERYGVRGGCVVDVGCGKGDFLATVCATGSNIGWGFDRSYSAEGATHAGVANITFVSEFFSERHSHINADLVCCRHVLEHIEDPRAFLAEFLLALRGSADPVIYFEVPNALFTLRDFGVWDLIYEHCSYFSAASLRRLFATSGFRVLDVREVYGGQFLAIECRRGPSEVTEERSEVDQLSGLAETFSVRFGETVTEWASLLGDLRQREKRSVVWGGGSKGVTFLNLFPKAGIERVVDINPRKQGKFVAGTGQLIIGPERLVEAPPDVVVLMNPMYAEEVRGRLQSLRLVPEFRTPMPGG